MFTRWKYSPLGRALRPWWQRWRGGQRTAAEETRRRPWLNLQQLLAADPIVDLPVFGGQFAVAASSHLFLRLLLDGHYEPELAELVTQQIDPARDAIDVGANIGFFTCLLAQRLPGQRVLAIEPTPGALRRLRGNLERNQIAERVSVFPGVVSSTAGEVELAVVEGKEEFSSLGSIDHPSVDKSRVQRVRVPAITLDELVEREGIQPGFVKMDVEGAEGWVLAGAERTFRKFRPVLISELSDDLLKQKGSSSAQVIAQLQDWGYRVVDPFHPELPAGARPFGDILALPN